MCQAILEVPDKHKRLLRDKTDEFASVYHQVQTTVHMEIFAARNVDVFPAGSFSSDRNASRVMYVGQLQELRIYF